MQAASERRDPHETRVPLSEVLIDLSPSGYDESFSADGINLGIGGLSMRSAILPDIGSQLRCRFQSPHDGTRVNADCEVVWSSDSGPNLGEFGLRFTGMTDDDQDSIGRMVEAWEHELAGEGDIVRLQLDGVGSPIEATAIHRAGDALLVEQPLPFLTIGTGVTEGGRRGVLQGVDLRLDDDMPRLVLTIWYEDPEEEIDEDSDDVPSIAFESDGGDTLMDAKGPSVARSLEVPLDAPIESSSEGSLEAPVVGHVVDDEPEARADQAVSVIAVPHRAVEAIEDEADEEEHDAEARELAARLRPDPRAALARIGRLARPAWARLRGFLAMAWVRVGPTITRGARRLRAFASSLGARIAPRLSALRSKTLKKATKRATRPAKRRQTRPPTSKTPAAPAVATKTPRKIGRWVLLGAVVLGLVAVVARAASTDEPVALAIKEEAPEPMFEPAADPELGDETFAAEVASPTPGEVPSDSPYADLGEAEPAQPNEATNEPTTTAFGASSVEGGREFTLRLSLAPNGLVGEETEDGFRVRVIGSNALDGARRIAGAHPRVAGASILNHGEEAELRIRFSPGEAPPYRVETRSAALLVTIGG